MPFSESPSQFFSFEVPASVLRPGLNAARLEFEKAYVPAKVLPAGESGDPRPLSMAVSSIRVVGAGWTNTEDAP